MVTLPSQEAIYDEARVPAHALPDVFGDGVATVAAWRERRRPELLRLFEQHVYGETPGAAVAARPRVEMVEDAVPALDGAALRTQVALVFGEGEAAVTLDLLLYTPATAKGPVPLFLGLNFYGNHSIDAWRSPIGTCADPWSGFDPRLAPDRGVGHDRLRHEPLQSARASACLVLLLASLSLCLPVRPSDEGEGEGEGEQRLPSR